MVQSRLLVRSAFCPKQIDHISGLTLHPGYNSVLLILIGTNKNLTLHPKRPYICGPYKRAPVYSLAGSSIVISRFTHISFQISREIPQDFFLSCSRSFPKIVCTQRCKILWKEVTRKLFDGYINDLQQEMCLSVMSTKYYRVTHLVANLGWVDFDLGCSTILLGH